MYIGIGKRKTSIAKVYISLGNGKILINNKDLTFIKNSNLIKFKILSLLKITKIKEIYNISIYTKGGGFNSQLDSINLALSKAISNINLVNRHILKKISFLKSDARIKERRKYGLKKARKAPQYTKR